MTPKAERHSDVPTGTGGLKIAQVVRRTGPGEGVSGVAQSLADEFTRAGIPNRVISAATMHVDLGRFRNGRYGHWTNGVEVVLFSLLAPLAVLYMRAVGNWVTITHNDCVLGDIFINHGVHRATVKASREARVSAKEALKNPLNLFLLARETLREVLDDHALVVNFSRNGQLEFDAFYHLSAQRVIIPNGVDLTAYHPDPLARPSDSRPSDSPLAVLFVGHDFKRKGLFKVLEAVARAQSDVRLTVVGGADGDLRAAAQEIERLGLLDKVTLKGRQSGVADYMRSAQVFVLPSANEAFPLALIEAMACGLACIATPVSSVVDLLDEGGCGMLIKGDVASITSAFDDLARDPALLSDLSERARARAKAYSWTSVAVKYVDAADSIRTSNLAHRRWSSRRDRRTP